MKVNLLKAEMTKNGVTGKELAKEMHYCERTFYDKLKKGNFTVTEAYWLIKRLNIPNGEEIFLS